jgi:hypothetical protein
MSHEGIRFVPKEDEARESEEARPLPRISITPEKVRVLLTEGKGVEIDWADGHRSGWSFAWLRDACPCATCVEERKLEGRKAKTATPAASIRGITCGGFANARSARLPPRRLRARRTRAHSCLGNLDAWN